MSLTFGVVKNQQNDAVTIRPSSSALLTIDSDDRFPDYSAKRLATPGKYNYSPYDFQINKQSSLMNGFITRIAVAEVLFPWTIPNINVKTNKIKVGYSTTGASGPFLYGTVSVPIGFYTPTAFATTFQSLARSLTGSLSTFVFTYNALTCQFTYNSGVGGVWVSIAPMDYNTVAYPYNSNVRQLFDVINLTSANTTVGIVTTPAFSNISYLQAIHYVDIVCNQLVLNQPLKDATSQPIGRDALCRLYISDATAPAGTFPGNTPTEIYRDYASPKQIQWTPNQPITSGLTFQVYDDQGDNLQESLSPGITAVDWNITLQVSEN